MISIGEFSKICKVTTRTLRHYDDIDLIKPSMINEENGYRFYDIGQIRDMLLITRLKNYNFSLEEIRKIIVTNDKEFTIKQIISKEEEIKNTIRKYKDIEKQMKDDILNLKRGFDIMSFIENIEVNLVEVDNINIISSRQKMSTDEYGKYIGKLFELAYSKKFTIIGSPMSIYHDQEFNHEENDTEIALPIKEKNQYTRILKGELCAKVEAKGPYSNLSEFYAKLVEWIDQNEYEIISEPYEKYIKGPMDGGEIITEIYFPVKKIR